MGTGLIVAAQTGNVDQLRSLMAGDPFLLKPGELTDGENPLHIACMGGHVDFVKEMLFHKPGYVEERNAHGLSPLHIASAYGYLDIVKELVKFGPGLCSVKSKDGKIPLHYAVVGGHFDVSAELIGACFDSIGVASDEGETCLHMAVKYNQVEVLQLLTGVIRLAKSRSLSVRRALSILNLGDKQGNTILHLAALGKHDGVLDHLLLTMKKYLRLNVVNSQGLTVLDVYESEAGRVETLKDELIKAGAKRAADLWDHGLRMYNYQEDFGMPSYSNETRNILLVVTVLIVAATFQAVMNPPGGVWQDTVVGNNTASAGNRTRIPSSELPHVAGTSVFATLYPEVFQLFIALNTAGFVTACLLSLFLTSPNTGVVWCCLAPMFGTYLLSAFVVCLHASVSFLGVLIPTAFMILLASVFTYGLADVFRKINNAITFAKYWYYTLFKTK